MKNLTIIAIALLVLAGCAQPVDTGKKELDEVSKKNVEVVKTMLTAVENEDIEALMEVYSPELVSYGPRHDQEWHWDTLNSTKKWFESVDSIKVGIIAILPHTVEEGDLAGDWVMVWANLSWYNPKAEKKVKIMWHSPYMIEDGKIVQEAAYWNEWDVFKQLGAELKWPEKKE